MSELPPAEYDCARISLTCFLTPTPIGPPPEAKFSVVFTAVRWNRQGLADVQGYERRLPAITAAQGAYVGRPSGLGNA